MPEKTELQQINKGIQKVTEILNRQTNLRTADSRQQEIERQWALENQKWEGEQHKLQENDRKEDEVIKKENLSTWGSIKAGINAFNISLEHEEDNKITWGKIGSQLKESIGAWYKQTLEMDNLLGKTFRVGAAIWENVDKYIISSFKKAFSGITSGIREVLGPVAEAFDAVKDAVMGVFGFFKGMYISIFGKVKPEDKVRNKLLQGIVDYFKSEKKKESREFDGKKKMPKFLTMLLFGLGVVIGAVVGAIVAPFRLLLGALKKIKPIGIALTKFFGEGSKFAKGLDKVKDWLKPIKTFFGKIGILGKSLAKLGKFLGPLTAGFKIGFKVLGWPLTILLGIIDAIRAGWTKYKEGGTVYEIIVAGIKGAFMGLFELPVKILGWVGDKILSMFSVEVEGGLADKIMKAISSIFNWIFKIPELITSLWKSIKSGFSFGEGDTVEDSNKLFSLEEPSMSIKIKEEEEERKRLERKRKYEEKLALEKKAEEEEIARIKKEEAAKRLLEEAKQTNVNINQLNQTAESNQQVEQIPDEIDSSLVGLELLWDF